MYARVFLAGENGKMESNPTLAQSWVAYLLCPNGDLRNSKCHLPVVPSKTKHILLIQNKTPACIKQ